MLFLLRLLGFFGVRSIFFPGFVIFFQVFAPNPPIFPGFLGFPGLALFFQVWWEPCINSEDLKFEISWRARATRELSAVRTVDPLRSRCTSPSRCRWSSLRGSPWNTSLPAWRNGKNSCTLQTLVMPYPPVHKSHSKYKTRVKYNPPLAFQVFRTCIHVQDLPPLSSWILGQTSLAQKWIRYLFLPLAATTGRVKIRGLFHFWVWLHVECSCSVDLRLVSTNRV